MYYKATPFIDNEGDISCKYDFEIGKRTELYILSYNDSESRNNHIDRTKYDWLQQNLERVVNNIRHLATEVHQLHYTQYKKQLAIIQAIKMLYDPSTPAKQLISTISNSSEAFYRLCPPKDSKYYKVIKSQITALVLYCEMN